MQRPTAVTVFAILNIGFGILGLVCTPLGLLASSFSQMMAENVPEAHQMNNPFQELMSSPGFMTYTFVSGILGMVVSGVLLVSGFGLLKLRPWARYFSIGYGVYSWIAVIVGGILSYFLIYAPVIENLSEKAGPETAPFMGGMLFGMIGGSCFSVVYPTILLIFMFLPDVKAAFQPGWGTPPPMPPVARQ